MAGQSIAGCVSSDVCRATLGRKDRRGSRDLKERL